MKRLLLLATLLAATPLFAINTNGVLHRGDRIGVLRMADHYEAGSEQAVAGTIEDALPGALHKHGFEAFDAQRTYEDARNGDAPPAAFYVEVVGAHAGEREAAGVGAGVGPIYTTVGVVVSRVAAEVRLYDGKTLALIDRWELTKRNTTVAPTSIGLGGRFFWADVALPFVRFGQYRSAAHDVARDAAARIAGAAQ